LIRFRNLAETRTPDGSRFSLHEHDGEYFLKLNGRQLMGSNSTVSERRLADLACAFRKPLDAPAILIGGLGLGFSLRRVLDLSGPKAFVQVAELLPEVVAWNRQFLADLNGRLLDDRRVNVFTGDVFDCIKNAPARFDAILLDVDNGPTSFVQSKNSRIYNRNGIALIRRALHPGGRVAFWSAEREPAFLAQLGRSGFVAQEFEAKAHERAKRAAHRIYVGEDVRKDLPTAEAAADVPLFSQNDWFSIRRPGGGSC
jgi:spermidine synthase